MTRKVLCFLGYGGPNGHEEINVGFVCERRHKPFTIRFRWLGHGGVFLPDGVVVDDAANVDQEFHQQLYDGGYIDLHHTRCAHCRELIRPPRRSNLLSRLRPQHRLATVEEIQAVEQSTPVFAGRDG